MLRRGAVTLVRWPFNCGGVVSSTATSAMVQSSMSSDCFSPFSFAFQNFSSVFVCVIAAGSVVFRFAAAGALSLHPPWLALESCCEPIFCNSKSVLLALGQSRGQAEATKTFFGGRLVWMVLVADCDWSCTKDTQMKSTHEELTKHGQ